MTNYEKYKEEIEELVINGNVLAIKNGKPVACHVTSCNTCDCRTEGSCMAGRKKWLHSEYKEPEIDWSKVPMGTHVWVRDDEESEWWPTLFVGYCLGEKPTYLCSATDLWVLSKRNGNLLKSNSKWKFCKLDRGIDPRPFYKED